MAPEDRKLSDLMQRYWTNFAKTGNPNAPDLPNWPVYNAALNWQVMHLGLQVAAQSDQHRDRYLFLYRVLGPESMRAGSRAGVGMNSIITAARLLNGDAIVENPIVTVDDGHIASIRSREGYPLPIACGRAIGGLRTFPARSWSRPTSISMYMEALAMT